MKLFTTFVICLLACTMSMGSIIASMERNLPPMMPSRCSAPAEIQGQAAVNVVVDAINEAGHIFRGVQGGCGQIILTKEQQDNFSTLFLADVRLDQPNVECQTMNSSNVDEPFGLAVEVRCSKMVKPSEGESFIAYLVIGVKIDKDGEVLIYFITASE